ncbi:E3 ubiquitin-protein ligase E3D isoform X2 [Pristis pectinata]|uniref:E3 ubiquitin-protein ligase E3D isoform X2 n=1 Tax=Pristis pectinata TaxID=685728 RepID=UPI00223CE650|nr:E3 ubiquitin-protein ligase E3D isoform X2 [Pristis pectinata]
MLLCHIYPQLCGIGEEMETKIPLPGVFLEIRNSTQTGHLVLGTFTEDRSELQVMLGLSSINLQTSERCMNFGLPAGVRIAPSSCRNLQYIAGDGFHMRLQLLTDGPKELVPTVIRTLKAQACYVFQCQSCGQSLLQTQMFRRVLPLPNGDWNDVVEHWCCHPNPFVRDFQPKLDDCLLGDTFLLVNVASVDQTAACEEKEGQSEIGQNADDSGAHLVKMPKKNKTVVCTRCRKMLGDMTSSDTIKFYITELLVQPLMNKTLERQINERYFFVENVVAGRLMELSSTQSTFRFCIQGHDGETYALLWLLNSDTLLVRSHNDPSSDFTAVANDTVKNESSIHLCEANNAVKVLYHTCLKGRNKIVQEKWEKNIGVHCMTFPANTCLELLLILASSTASLPPSLQSMNSFKQNKMHYMHPVNLVTVIDMKKASSPD